MRECQTAYSYKGCAHCTALHCTLHCTVCTAAYWSATPFPLRHSLCTSVYCTTVVYTDDQNLNHTKNHTKNHILQPNGFLMIFLMSCGSGFGLYTIVQCSVNDTAGREWPTSRLQCRQCSAVQYSGGRAINKQKTKNISLLYDRGDVRETFVAPSRIPQSSQSVTYPPHSNISPPPISKYKLKTQMTISLLW